jgi:hypothetical protein
MATEFITRCSNCAFDNSEDAVYCGMCGHKLAEKYKGYKSLKGKKTSYDKSVRRGTIFTAADYGHEVWQREMIRVIGFMLLFIIAMLIPAILTSAFWDSRGTRLFFAIGDIVLIAFFFGMACRGYLDAVRERRFEFWRTVSAGIMNLIPATLLLVLLTLIIMVVLGIVWLWMIPVKYLDAPGSLFSEGTGALFIFVWMVVLLVMLLLPVIIWLFIGSSFAMFRILDRKSSAWLAPIWAVRQIATHHWDLFKLGLGQLFVQFIGTVICYVGVIATIPLTGMVLGSVYEWLRLHGPKSDLY